MVSNLVEAKSRGAYIMGLTTYGNYSIEDTANFTVYVPKTDPHFATSLSVVPLQLPPLRERLEDLLPLAELFLARERARGTTRALAFEDEAAAALRAYAWPGNVRELKGVVERAALYAGAAERLPLAALPPQVAAGPGALWAGRERRPTLRDVERSYIRFVLDDVEQNQTRAAAILGISRKALWEKRRRFGMP